MSSSEQFLFFRLTFTFPSSPPLCVYKPTTPDASLYLPLSLALPRLHALLISIHYTGYTCMPCLLVLRLSTPSPFQLFASTISTTTTRMIALNLLTVSSLHLCISLFLCLSSLPLVAARVWIASLSLYCILATCAISSVLHDIPLHHHWSRRIDTLSRLRSHTRESACVGMRIHLRNCWVSTRSLGLLLLYDRMRRIGVVFSASKVWNNSG